MIYCPGEKELIRARTSRLKAIITTVITPCSDECLQKGGNLEPTTLTQLVNVIDSAHFFLARCHFETCLFTLLFILIETPF